MRITNIPIPGSSGGTPTGALQFRDDWPGLFLRGDSAIPVAVRLHRSRIRMLSAARSAQFDR